MIEKGRKHKKTAYAFGPVIFAYNSKGHIDTEIQITEAIVIDKVISRELRGLSPEVKIKWWECSLCHQNFEVCSHEVGEKDGDNICQPLAKEIEFEGCSLVQHPKDPRARVTDLLVIEDKNGKRYEWYGFSVITENQRFKHIQKALESKLISEKAAFYFGRYFSTHLEGKATYP